MLQASFDYGRLGRVEHQRKSGLGGKPAGNFGHVGHAVFAGVVDAHVEDVAAGPDRLLGHGRTRVPIAGQHGVAELLRAVGVRALADVQDRWGLVVGDVGVERGAAGFPFGVATGGRQPGDGVHNRLHVLRAGPATPAEDAHTKFCGEAPVVFCQLVRGQVVVHFAVHHRGQAGVGQA